MVAVSLLRGVRQAVISYLFGRSAPHWLPPRRVDTLSLSPLCRRCSAAERRQLALASVHDNRFKGFRVQTGGWELFYLPPPPLIISGPMLSMLAKISIKITDLTPPTPLCGAGASNLRLGGLRGDDTREFKGHVSCMTQVHFHYTDVILSYVSL